MIPTREAALELFLRHNRDEMHLRHARALEVVMRHFAPPLKKAHLGRQLADEPRQRRLAHAEDQHQEVQGKSHT